MIYSSLLNSFILPPSNILSSTTSMSPPAYASLPNIDLEVEGDSFTYSDGDKEARELYLPTQHSSSSRLFKSKLELAAFLLLLATNLLSLGFLVNYARTSVVWRGVKPGKSE